MKSDFFGLNLTAASYVVLFDPWWNPAVENQAIDRTHRLGQTNKVIAYRLLIKNSIEEKIPELQKQKKRWIISPSCSQTERAREPGSRRRKEADFSRNRALLRLLTSAATITGSSAISKIGV